MDRRRQGLLSWLTHAAIRWAPNRPDGQDVERRRRRYTFRASVSGWPLRMTTFVRDRLRHRWLKVAGEPGADDREVRSERGEVRKV